MAYLNGKEVYANITASGTGSGADGKSAYEIAVENGFEGTEEEWLASLKGEDGADGTNGASVTVISVERSPEDGGENVVTFSDGTTLTVLNGTKGSRGLQGASITVSQVGESVDDGGENIVKFSDGTILTVKNGSKGSQGEQGIQGEKGERGEQGVQGVQGIQGIQGEKGSDGAKGDKGDKGDKGEKGDPYTLTEADKAEIVRMVIESLGGNPIFGYVDENNNIIVSGNLADDSYSVKYEMENGSTVDIGNLVLDTNVYYSVTNNLTNCTSDNGASKVVEGESYIATITANDGYELKSVSATMGGSAVSVSGGVINIASVTGDIVITAVAEEKQAAEPVTVDIALTDGIRIGSDGGDRTQTGYCATPHIDLTNIPKPCTIRLTKAKWIVLDGESNTLIRVYAKKANGTALIADVTKESIGGSYFTVVNNSDIGNDVTVTVTSNDVGYIRFSGSWTGYGISDSTDSFAEANTKATLTYTPVA